MEKNLPGFFYITDTIIWSCLNMNCEPLKWSMFSPDHIHLLWIFNISLLDFTTAEDIKSSSLMSQGWVNNKEKIISKQTILSIRCFACMIENVFIWSDRNLPNKSKIQQSLTVLQQVMNWKTRWTSKSMQSHNYCFLWYCF